MNALNTLILLNLWYEKGMYIKAGANEVKDIIKEVLARFLESGAT